MKIILDFTKARFAKRYYDIAEPGNTYTVEFARKKFIQQLKNKVEIVINCDIVDKVTKMIYDEQIKETEKFRKYIKLKIIADFQQKRESLGV